jgi:hypothetical protein
MRRMKIPPLSLVPSARCGGGANRITTDLRDGTGAAKWDAMLPKPRSYLTRALGSAVTGLAFFGVSAFGCSSSPTPTPALSTQGTTTSASVTYTVQASAQTRAALGVVSWAVEIDSTGTHVGGHGAGSETIVTWTAAQTSALTTVDPGALT